LPGNSGRGSRLRVPEIGFPAPSPEHIHVCNIDKNNGSGYRFWGVFPAVSQIGGIVIERLTWRLSTVAEQLGISRRALERERSAGRFPKPDAVIGRMPLWKPETVKQWLDQRGAA